MINLPDPLDRTQTKAVRILSDKGIKQAIDQGIIKIIPKLEYEKDQERIQPATLDVKIKEIEGSEPIQHHGSFACIPKSGKELILPASSVSTINLTELFTESLAKA